MGEGLSIYDAVRTDRNEWTTQLLNDAVYSVIAQTVRRRRTQVHVAPWQYLEELCASPGISTAVRNTLNARLANVSRGYP